MACATLVLSGCASFRNNEVTEVGKLPDVSQYTNKPSVFVEAHLYRGDPGQASLEILTIKEKLNTALGRTLNESALFSKYSFDEKDRATSDYVIRLDIYNHGNTGLAAVAGFISGLTLTVIPAAATDNYTLQAKLLRQQREADQHVDQQGFDHHLDRHPVLADGRQHAGKGAFRHAGESGQSGTEGSGRRAES